MGKVVREGTVAGQAQDDDGEEKLGRAHREHVIERHCESVKVTVECDCEDGVPALRLLSRDSDYQECYR